MMRVSVIQLISYSVILLLISQISFAQSQYGGTGTPKDVGFRIQTPTPLDADLVWNNLSDTALITKRFDGLERYFKDVKQFWFWNGLAWKQSSSTGSGSGSDVYDGNFVTTSIPQAGVNYGGETVQEFLNNVFKQSVAPQCNISIADNPREIQTSGSISISVNWSVSRPAGCNEIVGITVDGQVITPTGGSQSGVINAIIPANTNRPFTIQVTSTDKSTTASTTLTWQWRRYWGRIDTQSPTNSDVLSLTGAGIGSGNELAASRVKTYDGINGAGEYLVFAFPESFGTPEFFVNGLVNTAFTKIVLTGFVNASAGTTPYQVWISNTPQNSPITQFSIR